VSKKDERIDLLSTAKEGKSENQAFYSKESELSKIKKNWKKAKQRTH